MISGELLASVAQGTAVQVINSHILDHIWCFKEGFVLPAPRPKGRLYHPPNSYLPLARVKSGTTGHGEVSPWKAFASVMSK
jgi:hypothetical protein